MEPVFEDILMERRETILITGPFSLTLTCISLFLFYLLDMDTESGHGSLAKARASQT
jgi:hypothetical protein